MKRLFKRILLVIVSLLLLFAIHFLSVRHMDRKAMEAADFDVPAIVSNTSFPVPARFIDAARFYVKLPMANGDTLLAFGDTGGGTSMVLPSAVEKKNLHAFEKTGIMKGLMPMKYMLFEELVPDNRFPKPYPMRHFILRKPYKRVDKPYLVLPPMNEETKFIATSMPEMDAFLGQNFFMGKAWTIDYPAQTITVNTPIAKTDTGSNIQALGFRKNAQKVNVYGHPAMVIHVDGKKIDMLFDTGATISLSKSGKNQFKTIENTIAGSFIAASVFEQWRKDHPEWKFYPKADMHHDVIEVPVVNIGGYDVGPVLFASRPDKNWSEGMIHSMDRIVKGALGGSGLKYLKVTIDYNTERIRFEKS